MVHYKNAQLADSFAALADVTRDGVFWSSWHDRAPPSRILPTDFK